jgi:hypothetical protein
MRSCQLCTGRHADASEARSTRPWRTQSRRYGVARASRVVGSPRCPVAEISWIKHTITSRSTQDRITKNEMKRPNIVLHVRKFDFTLSRIPFERAYLFPYVLERAEIEKSRGWEVGKHQGYELTVLMTSRLTSSTNA